MLTLHNDTLYINLSLKGIKKKTKQKTQLKNKNPPIVTFFRGINKKNPSLLRNIPTAFEG